MIDCICIPGYAAEADGVACTACGAGTYKTGEGTGTCSPCEAGTYSDVQGATSCSPCEAGTYKPAGHLVPCGRCTILKYELLCDVTVWS